MIPYFDFISHEASFGYSWQTFQQTFNTRMMRRLIFTNLFAPQVWIHYLKETLTEFYNTFPGEVKSTGLAGGVSQIDLESGEFCDLHKK